MLEIVFAAGCFWGVEKHFANLDGVNEVVVGYTGGSYVDPTYEKVLQHRNSGKRSFWDKLLGRNKTAVVNHTEAVKVSYDPAKISTETLIKSFWEVHDPTQVNRQGNDVGNNYRSGLYWTTREQKRIALQTRDTYQQLLRQKGYGTIVTEIKKLKKFYPAEEYHQDYLTKNPGGYCPNHATGVRFVPASNVSTAKVLTPKGGKEIIVVEAPNCPYCEQFKQDVVRHYQGSIPLRSAMEEQLKDFQLNTKIVGSPVLFFIKDGREVSSHHGYLSPKEFYKSLGAFKLGKNDEAYRVAFNQGTDSRFCKKYDLFKNTPDGVFVDKLSGEPLFDTKERFNSGTGWLSFYKAIDGATVEHEDFSHGMHRIEVHAKTSGIHLGHVFPWEDGKRRFCINATVLEFVPRDKVKVGKSI
jgi:peptide methionine sulfoxide reductase msrA/msrB